MSRSRDRNTRSSGKSRRRGGQSVYLFEDRRPVVVPVLGFLWRWRFEIGALLLGWLAWQHVGGYVREHRWLVAAGTVAVVGLVAGIPAIRRPVVARFWCVVTRHRLRTVFGEVRATTRSGRLPLILRVAPSPVGERAVLWCRAGVAEEDIADRSHHVRSACFARDARVARHPRWSHLVIVDVVRRDPLAAGKTIPSRLAPVPPAPTPRVLEQRKRPVVLPGGEAG